VLKKEARQQTEFGTRKPLFWDDGRKRMQVVITLQTDERDDANDDGVRLLFVKGKNMTRAIRDAVRAAGCSSLDVGGKLAIRYVRDDESTGGRQPPKVYEAKYQPPPPPADDPDGPAPEGDYEPDYPPDEAPF
jgi:hypothetical protein